MQSRSLPLFIYIAQYQFIDDLSMSFTSSYIHYRKHFFSWLHDSVISFKSTCVCTWLNTKDFYKTSDDVPFLKKIWFSWNQMNTRCKYADKHSVNQICSFYFSFRKYNMFVIYEVLTNRHHFVAVRIKRCPWTLKG